jgi:quercetin dioxygenase-like cupin family protein
MINVKGEYVSQDRWVLNLTKIESGEERTFNLPGTNYVMMKDAEFEDEKSLVKKSCSCVMTSNGEFTVRCKDAGSSAIVINTPGLRYLERRIYTQDEMGIGNLSYMDGGTNNTAINPGRLGDPVINYVHFPAGMYQTLHTHPSHRIGLILRGSGQVELDNHKMYELNEGEVFFMRRNELHNFITTDDDVLLFVFAPDSGTGPTDEVNPLKIRTYIGQQRHAK